MIAKTRKDIIVLEGSGIFRDRLGAMLTEAGHTVTLAHDCASLMDKLAGGVNFAALVMDIDMPGADSFSILEWLRETDTRCPVLFVTESGGEEVSSEDEAVFYAPCVISKNQPHAAIMKAINKHLFPDMPSKRAKDRVYGAIPASFVMNGQRDCATILNMCRNGVFLHADADMPVGSVISVDFSLPSVGCDRLCVPCVVRWNTGNLMLTSRFSGAGLEFKELGSIEREFIDRYMTEAV